MGGTPPCMSPDMLPGKADKDTSDITGIGNTEPIVGMPNLSADRAKLQYAKLIEDSNWLADVGLSNLVIEWKVAEVCTYLQALELGHLTGPFCQNGIDGRLLMELSVEDLSEQ